MEELDLKELFSIFWNKKVWIIIITIIFIILGAVYSFVFVEPEYQASTTLLLAKTNTDQATENTTNPESITQTDITLNQKLVSTYSVLVQSKSVIREVINNLGIEGLEEEDLKNSVTVNAVEDTEVIKITVTNKNPDYAAKIANEIANVFSKKVTEIYNINNVYVVDVAEIENEPYNINHAKDIVIFAFIGIVVACAYILIRNMLDNTIKSDADVEKMGLTVLAQLPIYDFDERVRGGK